MKLMAPLLCAVVLSSACCTNPTPKVEFPATPPPALNLVQAIQTEVGLGLLSPISPTQALTAAHMVEKEGPIKSYDSRLWHVQWRNTLRDLAMLELDEGQPQNQSWLIISTKRPKPTELHWMKAYFGFNSKNQITIAPIVGRFITIDVDKNILLDSWSFGGMSGGGVINSRGELVGVVTSSVFPAGEGRYRALLMAADLTGGIK